MLPTMLSRDNYLSEITYIDGWRAALMAEMSMPTGRSLPNFFQRDSRMSPGSVYRDRTSLKSMFVALCIALVGILLLVVSEKADSWGIAIWKPIIANVGGLLVASVGLAALWELASRRAFVAEIFDVAGVAHEVQIAKLAGITTKFMTGVPWTKLIDSSKELDIMVSAGQTWRNTYDQHLKSLASRSGAKINVILPDPTDQQVVGELARRFGYTAQSVAENIRQSELFFRGLADAQMARGALRIWYLKSAPMYTFYRLDNVYVFASYRHSKKGDVLVLVSQKGGCIADFIDEQFGAITDKKGVLAKQVFPSKDRSGDSGIMQADTMNVPAESKYLPPINVGDEVPSRSQIQTQISTES
jgi:hypothetical protein